jgi:arsenate reductase-like glutaredoxin family protein
VKAELSQEGVELNERDFFKDGFTEQELRELLGDVPPSEIFSWRSPSFKKLNLEREKLTEDDLVRLMIEEPRLIRRPLVVVDGRLIVGTDKKAMAAAFSG